MADVSPILQALYVGRRDEVDALLAEMPELDLFEAAALGQTDRVAELVERDGSVVGARSPDGFTALHLAAFFGQADVARLLADRGADVDAVAENPLRVTPLHSAAAARQTEIARLLLEHGADPNARQEGGFTPLHAAAQNGDEELAKLLLRRGADPRAATDDGRGASRLAREAGHAELAQRLEQ